MSVVATNNVPDEKLSKGTAHINFLDGIRGFSAVYVVLYHFGAWNAVGLPRIVDKLLLPLKFGHSAVSVFIVLSGFSLMLSVAASKDQRLKGGLHEYIVRRARRILPPYYAAVALSLAANLVLHCLPNSPSNLPRVTLPGLISHLFLYQNLNPDWSAELNFALWSVATEWQIYFVFPLFLLPVWRRFGNLAAIVFGFLLSFVPSVFVSIMCHRVVFFSAGCPWYVGLFATGMAGAVLFSRAVNGPRAGRSQSVSTTALWLGVLASVVAVILAHLLSDRNDVVPVLATLPQYATQVVKDGGTGSAVFCLILLLAFNQPDRGNRFLTSLRTVLESTRARLLGSFSYSLYLTHAVVLSILLFTLDDRLSPIAIYGVRVLIGIPVATLLGYLFFLGFERPTLRRGTSRTAKAMPQNTVVTSHGSEGRPEIAAPVKGPIS